MKKKIFETLLILFAVYVVGSIIWVVLLALKGLNKVRIVSPENLPKLEPGMIIVSNHPDLLNCMYEIFLLPAIFFPQIALHPIKLMPWFTPDKHNFTDKWYWAWLKPRAISVQRDNASKGASEARKMLGVLKEQFGVLVHFIEPGRTCTGKSFLFSKNKNKKIRTPKSSVGWLALKTESSVWSVWLENGEAPLQPDKKLFSWPSFSRGSIIVKYGKIMEASAEIGAMSPRELTGVIAENLLELADQE